MEPNTPESASCVVSWSFAAVRRSIGRYKQQAISRVLGKDSRGVVCLYQLTQKNDLKQPWKAYLSESSPPRFPVPTHSPSRIELYPAPSQVVSL